MSLDIPFITIGITCHNASDTVEKAVLSAAEQIGDIKTEIVIVDDHSDDDTIQILKQLEKQNPNLNIIYQSVNKGVAASRNKIIEQAQGEFIAFFDDDDISAPDRLQKQYERIISYEKQYAGEGLVICHAARTQIYPDGAHRYEPTMGMNEGIAPHGAAVADRILIGRPMPHGFGSIATCSQMARTQIYKDLGKFDESFRRGEDTDFNIRAALAGAHFVGLAEPLIIQTMTMASDKKLSDDVGYVFQLLQKHKILVETKTSYKFCHAWLMAKYEFLQGHKGRFILKMMGLMLTNPVRTVRRLFWSLPNFYFNLKLQQFHSEKT